MKTNVWNLAWWVATAAFGAVLVAGCCDLCSRDEEPKSCPYPEGFLRKEWPTSKTLPARTVRRPYYIREGDKLEIIYNIMTRKEPEDYELKIRDVMNVSFPFNKDLNQDDAEVQSDGTVQLPLLGSVQVLGMSVDETQKELVRRYSEYVKNPVITLTFKESKRDIMDLREAITTSPRGQSRLVPVTPDGTVALPLVGSVLAAGYTVDEVHDAVNKAYRNLGLVGIEVTVNLEFISPLQVYVLGEVTRPGLVFNTLGGFRHVTEMSLLQALAQAGSYKPARAELSKVLLIRYRNVPSPQVAVVNVRRLLENRGRGAEGNKTFVPDSAKFRRDIWLEDGDVLYVPTKKIAERADYIEYVWTRGIYSVVPISYSIQATYGAVDTVDWLGPNP